MRLPYAESCLSSVSNGLRGDPEGLLADVHDSLGRELVALQLHVVRRLSPFTPTSVTLPGSRQIHSEIRDRSYENQRHRTSRLNLIVSAIVLWNTTYLQRAVDHLKRRVNHPTPGDLAHLSPLGWEHINLTGNYHWRHFEIWTLAWRRRWRWPWPSPSAPSTYFPVRARFRNGAPSGISAMPAQDAIHYER